jgi:Skp family chaperone for outer membrane proteins
MKRVLLSLWSSSWIKIAAGKSLFSSSMRLAMMSLVTLLLGSVAYAENTTVVDTMNAPEGVVQKPTLQVEDSAKNNAKLAKSPTSQTVQRQVAVVNIAVLMENSPRSQAIADRIKSEYFPQEQLLNKEREALRMLEEQLDAESTRLSDEERLKRSRDFRSRKRKYTRDYEDFRDRLSNARQKALELVRQDVLEAVDHVRTEAGIAIVLEDYVLASEDADLTPKVLSYLQALYQQTADTTVPNESTEETTPSQASSVPSSTESATDNSAAKQNSETTPNAAQGTTQ